MVRPLGLKEPHEAANQGSLHSLIASPVLATARTSEGDSAGAVVFRETRVFLVFFVTKSRRTDGTHDGKPVPHPSRRALTTNLDERIGSERRPRARHGATSRQH